MNARLAAPLLLLALLPATACDKANPVAPSGSILLLSASPSQIGINGTSTITVIGRKPDGQPLNPGTEIRLTTSLGTISPQIVQTGSGGQATATLRGDGRLGVATVTASTGGNSTTPPPAGGEGASAAGPGSASIEVEIGTPAATIVLQPNPTTLSADGGTVNLVALVRDSRGQPLVDQPVNFTTEIGRLNSRGGIVRTDANGQARDRLTVTAQDLSLGQRNFTVAAQTTGGTGDGAGQLIEDTFEIQVASDRPEAAFSFTQGANDLTVDFSNESIGTNLSYNWTFGDGSSSTLENPSHTYPAAGTYTVRLVVTDNTTQLSDTETQQITVPVDDN